jgi:hypothetical protein
MVDILRPLDTAAVIVTFLKAQYTARSETAGVGTRLPATTPARFTRVRVMGGRRSDLVRYASVVVFECYGSTDVAACDLARLTEALVQSMEDQVNSCTRVVDIGGLVDQPDPDSNNPRWVFTKQIWLRSTVLV